MTLSKEEMKELEKLLSKASKEQYESINNPEEAALKEALKTYEFKNSNADKNTYVSEYLGLEVHVDDTEVSIVTLYSKVTPNLSRVSVDIELTIKDIDLIYKTFQFVEEFK